MIDIKDINSVPSIEQICAYVGLPLLEELCQYMETEYRAIRKIEYSKDVWARGLNGGLCPVHLDGYCPVVEAAGVTSHVK